ncbi:MAG: hypothetical protein HYV27_23270 [Candidatus Hydrogenedentes bacterium]|nr:hypothetical protein [Candidatus Hydrogenedentota bacterium]
MKKLAITACAAVLGAGVAFASSLSVPWFVDNAPAANKVPGVAAGVTGMVTLKNNTPDTLTLQIAYYAQDGTALGPAAPGNTFTVVGNSSLAFRPGANDPDTATGGQEGTQGVAVPDRPTTDGKKNGALTVQWVGDPTDVQGVVTYFQTTIDSNRGGYTTLSYAHQLPEGF